jgi:hypothetical protein
MFTLHRTRIPRPQTLTPLGRCARAWGGVRGRHLSNGLLHEIRVHWAGLLKAEGWGLAEGDAGFEWDRAQKLLDMGWVPLDH